MLSKIQEKLKKTILIDAFDDGVIIFKPTEIKINGRKPYELRGKHFSQKQKTEYGYPTKEFKSDNIAWMAKCEMYKFKV